MNTGLLLINLGSPDNPSPAAVKKYLAEFLADKRVINLPGLLRYLLLYGVILPFRPRRSAHAYQKIWTDEGSPLIRNCQMLTERLQDALGSDWVVALGMRYGAPRLQSALAKLKHCERLIILPLYPQYSSSASGSSIEAALGLLRREENIPSINLIRDFHQDDAFIKAQAHLIKPYLDKTDYLLFSYHGVPENHLLKAECKSLCASSCSSQSTRYASCYRAQCHRTTELLARELQLKSGSFGLSFQSRLGRTPWIRPYTDEILASLANAGVKRLTVACPSFVADCLETLEEIGIRAQEQWLALGGSELTLTPSLNDHEIWVQAIISMVYQQ